MNELENKIYDLIFDAYEFDENYDAREIEKMIDSLEDGENKDNLYKMFYSMDAYKNNAYYGTELNHATGYDCDEETLRGFYGSALYFFDTHYAE